MATKSMTYGTLPTRDEIDALFAATCGSTGYVYRVELKGADLATFRRVEALEQGAVGEHGPEAVGAWNSRDVFNVLSDLETLWSAGDDDAGNLASSILATLGVEWI
jgi:hypothetical protein